MGLNIRLVMHVDTGGPEPVELELHDVGITHNLTGMAAQAGLYDCLWDAQSSGIFKAKDLLEPLRKGLERMKADPERFRRWNPPNGWGDYDAFVVTLQGLLNACERHPLADVEAEP